MIYTVYGRNTSNETPVLLYVTSIKEAAKTRAAEALRIDRYYEVILTEAWGVMCIANNVDELVLESI